MTNKLKSKIEEMKKINIEMGEKLINVHMKQFKEFLENTLENKSFLEPLDKLLCNMLFLPIDVLLIKSFNVYIDMFNNKEQINEALKRMKENFEKIINFLSNEYLGNTK
jgi:cytoplasmic iron level regulating protein YaaA (DUF328/UPF0246 family)